MLSSAAPLNTQAAYDTGRGVMSSAALHNTLVASGAGRGCVVAVAGCVVLWTRGGGGLGGGFGGSTLRVLWPHGSHKHFWGIDRVVLCEGFQVPCDSTRQQQQVQFPGPFHRQFWYGRVGFFGWRTAASVQQPARRGKAGLAVVHYSKMGHNAHMVLWAVEAGVARYLVCCPDDPSCF